MKNLLVSIAFLSAIALVSQTSTAESPSQARKQQAKIARCQAECTVKWEKKFHACNFVNACERYTKNEYLRCIDSCQKKK